MAYERINWSNDDTTPINTANLNKMDEGIYNNSIRNILTAKLTENVSYESGTTGGKLVLSESSSSGSSLSISEDGGIKIGANISQVIVSAGTRITNNNESSASAYNLYIYKNSSIVVSGRVGRVESGITDGISISPFLLNVEEGDIIYLAFWKTSTHLAAIGSTYSSTFLTVEALA